MKRQRWPGMAGLVIFVAVLAVLAGVSLTIAERIGDGEEIRLEFSEGQELTEGWTVQGVGKEYPIVSFPHKAAGHIAYFYYQIPEHVKEEEILILENRYQILRVSIDGKEIFEYGMDEDSDYFMPDSLKCYIEILPEYKGKQLEVFIDAWRGTTEAILYTPVLSTKGAIAMAACKRNIVPGAFCIVSVVIGAALLAASVMCFMKKLSQRGIIFGSLSLFMWLSSLWILTDSSLLQMFIMNSQIRLVASFEVFMLLPIPLTWFVITICDYKGKVFRLLNWGFFLNYIVQNLLYIAKISNFIYMVSATHVIFLISILYLVYYMLRESVCCHSYYARGILIGIGTFACMSGIAIVTFYHSRGMDNERFFILGFALLMADLLLLSIRKLHESTEQEDASSTSGGKSLLESIEAGSRGKEDES